MLLFADSGERAIVQAVLIGSVVSRIRGTTARRDGAHTRRARSGTSVRGPERAASLRWERGPGSVSRADHPHRTMPEVGLGAIVHGVSLGTETRPGSAA